MDAGPALCLKNFLRQNKNFAIFAKRADEVFHFQIKREVRIGFFGAL